MKLAAQLIIKKAVEGEMEARLRRADYGRGGGGQCNGYRRGKLEMAEGRVKFGAPQVRDTAGWRLERRLLTFA